MAGRKKVKDEQIVDQTPYSTPVGIPVESSPSAGVEAPVNGEVPGNKPAYFVSVPVGRDTYVQASIWSKTVELRDGDSFTTHEVTVRKRYKDANGDFQSTHKFRASELYALEYVIRRSEQWILDARATEAVPF
jgi:hypothetical protein